MKLPGTAADFLPASVAAAGPEQPVEETWPQGADDGTSWWWSPDQAATYPAQWAVVDTNQVLDHLEAVQCIVAQMTGVNCIVPRVVLKELEILERLEESGGTLQARAALQYLRSQLLALGGFRCSCAGDRSSLVLQGESESVYEGLLGKPESKARSSDDQVLACTRYFAEVVAPDMTELLTSDPRLAIKAAFHGIPAESVLTLMGRGVPSNTGMPLVDVGAPLSLGMSGLMTLAAEHAAESYTQALFDSDGNDVAAPGGPPGLPHVDAAPGHLGARHRLKAAKAAQGEGHGCAASTRSPSSDDGCGERTTASSSPEGFTLESPLGPVPQASPRWRLVPSGECDEDGEEDADEDDKNPDPAARAAGGKGGAGGECIRKGRATDATSVVLRGLPFNVTEEEVLAFIRKAGVSREDLSPEGAVALLANAQGRPSGFAEIRLARGVDFWDVRVQLHMQHLRGRYIEALPPRPARKSAAKKAGRQDGRKE